MKHKSYLLFLLLFIFIISFLLYFILFSYPPSPPKKRKTILFTNVRDETHIREWVDHHLSLGFEFIYIFDHMSQIPVSKLVNDLGNVMVERIDKPFTTDFHKMTLINKAVDYAQSNEYEWMLYLDGDEFLYLRDDKNINDFLDQYKYTDQLGINWLLFGSNNLENEPPGIRRYYTKSNRFLDRHVKSFVKPSSVEKSVNPHYYIMSNHSKTISWDGTEFQGPFYGEGKKIDKNSCNAYIAHYFSQCYDVYKKRKMSRQRDDAPELKWDVIPREKFHKEHNDIENYDMQKYINF